MSKSRKNRSLSCFGKHSANSEALGVTGKVFDCVTNFGFYTYFRRVEVEKTRSTVVWQRERYKGLRLAFHDESSSLAIEHSRFNEYKRNRTNLTDDLRQAPPSMATTENNISTVRAHDID
ncbi:hypothetical protein EVAR_16482_1 [Eumeta japonica]|uniref:Uncharacterized protein n=1 Tax=Eumeta variegata TaxID=151549 RepID=A0A4C1UL59_EUMVA|nr:hypothetical protein EVAR_16482_1 [Eumeta japonica]